MEFIKDVAKGMFGVGNYKQTLGTKIGKTVRKNPTNVMLTGIAGAGTKLIGDRMDKLDQDIAEYEESEVWILGDALPVDKLWVRSPSKTNVSEDSVTVGPIIQALYCQYIDYIAFDEALRDELSDGRSPFSNKREGFDEKSYERLASESIILNPRF